MRRRRTLWRARLDGNGRGELGLVGAITSGDRPDINQAIEWFEDVMGAVAPLTFGPLPAGPFVASVVNVAETTSIDQITMLRIGHAASIELFKYTAPDGQRQDMPKNSDWTGHHVAFYVTDIDAAVEYMVGKGVRRMPAGRSPSRRDRRRGRRSSTSRPLGRLHRVHQLPERHGLSGAEREAAWSPKLNGMDSLVTTVPGLLGIDHVGITVPSIDIAAAWFEQKLGFINPLTFGPFSDPTGTFMTDLVDVNPRAVVAQIRVLRGGNGPGVELFQYTSPDQDQTFRKNSDWGGHHIAFYVRDIDKGVEYLQTKAGTKLFGPVTLTDGPAAGQSINYFETPFGPTSS